jgi:hypothetical protein
VEDDYARSVADAAVRTATARGVREIVRASYSLSRPDWRSLTTTLRGADADVIIFASHIPDGIEFRRQMLAAGVRTGALIGSTMAQCDPDFAGDLGPDAVGVFASDRPTGGFQPGVLGPAARRTYDRFATAWSTGHRARNSGAGDDRYTRKGATPAQEEYRIDGPVESGVDPSVPTEEGLAGFSAAWALFHEVLPATRGDFSADSIASAARSIDLPDGALPNGAGLRFSHEEQTLGQNERAAAVIWQWQAVRAYEFVWPRTYATGSISFVPLER